MSNDIAIQSLKGKIDELNQQAWDARVSGPSMVFELTQESLKLAKSINYKKGIAEATRSLGFYYARLAKNDEAQPLLKESLSLFESLNDLRGQAVVYEYLAIVQRSWGNLGDSLEFLFKALELSQRTGFKESEAFTQYQIGVTYKHLGNFEKALDHLYKSLSTHRETNNKLYQSYPINIIGSIYFENGDYTKALEYYKEGLISRQESNDKLGEAGSLDNIGFTYLKLKDYSQAIEYCTKSLSINETTGDKRGQGNALLHLAEAYKQTGDIEKATNFSNDSLEIKKATGDKKGEAELLLFLADLHKTQPENDKNILEWLNNSLKIAEEMKAVDLLGKTHFHLYEYYKQKGDFEEALKNLDLHTNLEKEFHKNAINQKVSNLEISHKAEAISQRNKELTELNEQIEKANAELKIEASLERVRTTAMAMKDPADMLQVCRMISDQLLQLGFKEIRNVQTVIIYPQRHEYLNYQYFTPYDKDSIETIDYRLHPDVLEFTNQMLSSPDAYYNKTFEGEQLRVWRGYRKQTNQLHDPKLDEATSSHYYFYSIGSGALGVTTYAPLSDGQIDLFKRFRNVFALAYRRFIDIEKALAQAREAQIETALERVRSKTMAMHQSEEVTGVAVSLNEELLKLGFEGGSTIIIINRDTGDTEQWTGFSEDKSLKSCCVPYFKHPCHDAVLKAWKNGEKFLVYTLAGDEKRSLDEHYFTTGYKLFPESDKKWMIEMESVTFSHAFMKYGAIHWGPGHLAEEQSRILQRFSKVFEQSYTRFLDLQKAEAQAREAQIQLALERVRASTMAMHKSDELPASANLLFHQVHTLGVPAFAAGYCIWEDDKQAITLWMSSEGVLQPPFKAPTTEDELFIQMRKGYEDGRSLHVVGMGGEELSAHYRYMRTLPVVGEIFDSIQKAGHPLPSFQVMHYAYFSKGFLLIITYEPVPDAHDIFKRFAKVFEQTYTRFLDLQKAEAQTREAQIEVAVERVRAKALAMHRSEDLHSVVVTLKKELMGLQIPDITAATIYLAQDDGSIRVLDLSDTGGDDDDKPQLKLDIVFRLEDTDPNLWIRKMWDRSENYFVLEADEDDFARVVQFIRTVDPAGGDMAEKIIREKSIKKAWLPTVKLEKGIINIDLLAPPSPEIESILLKMGAGFDLAYKRFLDLQKAEAQTKEAQTEVALERIRARAMAMHSSNELMDVAHILREQMGLLDQPDLETSVINLFDEDSDHIHSWHAFREPGSSSGKTINGTVSFRKDSSELTREMIGHYHSGKKEYTLEATGEKLNEFIQVLINSEPEISNYIGKNPPEKVYYHFATFAGGALLTVSYQPTTEDIKLLQRRAASVFDMAYRRYRDLKKAEAQTREAQIEIAVERVRAKALAMHKSEEILSVVVVLRNELLGLNIPGVSGTTIYLKQDDRRIRMWDLTSVIELEDGFHLSMDIVFPLAETHPELFIRKIWNATEKYSIQIQNRDDLMRTVEWLAQYKKEEAENVKRFIETSDLRNLFHSTVPLANGKLSVDLMEPPPAEMESILQKMATAFDLAYKRFLDLQKAEAQTREAQIEIALERVRSRTMAMHRSDELSETSSVLFGELKKLGIHTTRSGFGIYNEPNQTIQLWLTALSGENGETNVLGAIPLNAHTAIKENYNAWKEKKPMLVHEFSGDQITKYYQQIGEYLSLAQQKTYADRLVFSVFFFSEGSLNVMSDVPLTDDECNIMLRFANVFGLTYRRFLDLLKAEAQAREAQIETALEKVRTHTVGMRSSEDLSNVATAMFDQIRILGGDLFSFGIVLCDKHENIVEQWHSVPHAGMLTPFLVPVDLDYIHRYRYDQWKAAVDLFSIVIPEDYIAQHFELMLNLPSVKAVWEGIAAKGISLPPIPTWEIDYGASFKYGYLLVSALKPFEEEKIFPRFAKVFEQTYTRFLDLQKAEAQAREAQIEAALERVRAKVMAMTNSKELNETSLVFGEQLRKLGIDWQFSYFWLIEEAKNENTFWITWPDYKTSLTSYTLPEAEEYFNDCLISWRAGVKIHDNYVPPEGVQEWLDTFQRIADDAGGEAKRIMVPKTFPNGVYYYDAMMKYGSFGICISKPATDEEKNIQCRFAIEFERAYTRFLDLKQAEAQARESQIELGLERVRARAMAMQKSDELKELIGTVSTELSKLDLILDRCFIAIFDAKTYNSKWWMAAPETPSNPMGLTMQYHEMPPYLAYLDAWKTRQLKWQYLLEGEIKKEWDEFTFSETEFSHLPDFVIANMRGNNKVYLNASFNSFGCLTLATLEPLSGEHFDIMLRFAKVFDLTYTRFNDLKQAEAQTRESQIELGLERVRARAMAMQKSDELKELIGTVSTELSKLDIILDRCFIMTYDIKTLGVTWWMANPETPSDPISLYVKYHNQTPYLAFLKAWQDRTVKWQYILEGEVKKTWDKFLFVETELSQLPDFVIDNMRANDKVYLSASFNNFGCLTLATLEPLSDEQFDIMLRFAKVFDLTYTRFNDLKQAEAQAREAQIELALERVRARTMAMQKSDELADAAQLLYHEFGTLGLDPFTCGYLFIKEEQNKQTAWVTLPDGTLIPDYIDFPLTGDHILDNRYKSWRQKEVLHKIELHGEENKEHHRFLASKVPAQVANEIFAQIPEKIFIYCANFSAGYLFIIATKLFRSEAEQTIVRFAKVFEMTYTRFLDLKQAEAQARAAKIEAALERVRARALAMQEPEELKDVAQVLRTEMGLLGVEELETCSIYINDEIAEKAECWYALKDVRSEEKQLVSDHFALNLNDTWVGKEMLQFYNADTKQISIVMTGDNRKEWIRYCEEKSVPLRGYYGEVIPDRTYHLYKFSHGAIGAAAAGDISEESWGMLSRAASVFTLAYSRFKDLTQARTDLIQLKEEKKRAEDALTELQATQKQLIQAEKMASLGELTAGIAHEIQNPLNFVNNFSDVSHELLEEMRHELATGNTQQAIEIVNDVKENLEKILHHGKRADAIVKGMLQHSRSSSGQKEPTDINVLAEEYLRLAYHGLRAKDKFFNAKFETDLDPSINKINIVPQEIGRVILNLINNAFYTVSEKKKSHHSLNGGMAYEPIVTVTTKGLGSPSGDGAKVEIRVKDNGYGIPQKVLDKIFQPFFTTKPTGQGTGLGLSLSYDIITKGHDGEIKVETKEGEGSEFIISLPAN